MVVPCTNRTITLTPESNKIGTTTISVIVTDSSGLSATNSFLMTVNPGLLTVTGITASNKTYNGTTNATLSVSSASLAGQGLTGSGVTLNTNNVSGAFVDKNVGANKPVQISGLLLNGANAGNYILTQPITTASITRAALTVSATNRSKVYGQVVVFGGNEFVVSGLVSTDVVTSASLGSAGAGAGAGVGGYAITVTNAVGDAGLTNYLISYVNGTLTVGTAGLTVSANSAVRGYGQTNPVLGGTLVGVQGGDGIAAVYSTVATTNSGVGNYVIVAGLNDPNGKAGNYVVTTNNGVLVVTNGLLTVSATNRSKVYGQVVVFGGNEFVVSGLVSTDVVTSASLGSAGAGAGAGVGGYAITVTNAVGDAGLTNYLISYVNGTLTVGTAGLTVSANSAVRGYGQTNPVLGGTLVGVQGGDGIAAVYSTVATTNSGVGNYVIVAGLNDPNGKAGNYVVTTNNGVLVVTNGLLTVSATNRSKVYGQVVVFGGNEFVVSGLVSTDVVTSASLGSAGAGAGAGVGGYAITVTNAVGDAGLTNYLISYVNGTLTVTPPGKIAITSIVLTDMNHALITGTGDASAVYTIQASSDLMNWQSLGTATADVNGVFNFQDSNVANFSSRFYRVVLQ